MRVETRSAAALRARVRRFGGVLGCWNGMRRMEVKVGIGMFVVFVVDRIQSLEVGCLFLFFINTREIVLKLNRTDLYPVGPNPGLT